MDQPLSIRQRMRSEVVRNSNKAFLIVCERANFSIQLCVRREFLGIRQRMKAKTLRSIAAKPVTAFLEKIKTNGSQHTFLYASIEKPVSILVFPISQPIKSPSQGSERSQKTRALPNWRYLNMKNRQPVIQHKNQPKVKPDPFPTLVGEHLTMQSRGGLVYQGTYKGLLKGFLSWSQQL